MKLKGRTILVLCLLLFGGYALYDFQQDKKTEERTMEEARLLTVNFEQVHEVFIQRGNQKVVLQRGENGWELLEPLKDLADNTVVEDFIKNTVPERILEVAKEGDGIDWALYGLTQPMGTITFKTTAGTQNVFEISEIKNFEENSFVRRDGANKVLVVNSAWQTRVKKTALDFRDRRFLRHKIASVDEVKLKNEKGLLHLKRVDGQWIVATSKETKLDQNKVRELLSTMADAKAADILSVDSKKESLKKLFGLELKLNGKAWSADVGQTKDLLIFATISEPKFYLKMEPGALDKLIKMTVEDLKEQPPQKDEPQKDETKQKVSLEEMQQQKDQK